MKIYGIYDMKDKEQVVKIGDVSEIFKFLNLTPRSFNRVLKRNELINRRYELHYLFEE